MVVYFSFPRVCQAWRYVVLRCVRALWARACAFCALRQVFSPALFSRRRTRFLLCIYMSTQRFRVWPRAPCFLRTVTLQRRVARAPCHNLRGAGVYPHGARTPFSRSITCARALALRAARTAQTHRRALRDAPALAQRTITRTHAARWHGGATWLPRAGAHIACQRLIATIPFYRATLYLRSPFSISFIFSFWFALSSCRWVIVSNISKHFYLWFGWFAGIQFIAHSVDILPLFWTVDRRVGFLLIRADLVHRHYRGIYNPVLPHYTPPLSLHLLPSFRLHCDDVIRDRIVT